MAQFITGLMPSIAEPPKPYVHQPYPSYRWCKDGRTALVENAEDDAKLGDDWSDTPATWGVHPEAGNFQANGRVLTSADLTQAVVAPFVPSLDTPVVTVDDEVVPPNKRGRKSNAEKAALAAKG